MALMGRAVLAIWHGIAEDAEGDFIAWHTREHMPERVGLPGFLRGRRYVALEGHPRFFNFYETESVETFGSPIYRDRLNDPTPWTRRVVPHFHDTSRTVCGIPVTLGCGEGAFIETVRFSAGVDAEAVIAAFADDLIPKTAAAAGIVGAHLWRGLPSESRMDSAEQAMRSRPDQISDWVLLVEAVDDTSLSALRSEILTDAIFERIGAADSLARGIYRLQFALSKQELTESR